MNKYRIEIKWAFIFIAAIIFWMLIEKIAGLHSDNIDKQPIYSNLFAIPAIYIYLLALLNKRKIFFNGRMNWKQGVITGLIITLIVTAFSPLTQIIISDFISPEYFTNAIEYSVRENILTQEIAENYFNSKSYILQGLAGTLVMGSITSAIVAVITKNVELQG